MVSGRSESQAACSRCGKLWIELDLADRHKRICVLCIAKAEPLQLSLLRQKPKEKQRKACERKLEPSTLGGEQLTILNTMPKKKPQPRPLTPEERNVYEYRVYCEKCNRVVSPQKEPWYAGKCRDCWEPWLVDYYLEELQKWK